MTPLEHQQEHIRLHRALDELIACFFNENMGPPGTMWVDGGIGTKTPLIELMTWSHQKTMEPSPADGTGCEHPRSVADFEAQRQMICLALAKPALERPGFEEFIKEIARNYDMPGLPTYESLKRSNADRVKESRP